MVADQYVVKTLKVVDTATFSSWPHTVGRREGWCSPVPSYKAPAPAKGFHIQKTLPSGIISVNTGISTETLGRIQALVHNSSQSDTGSVFPPRVLWMFQTGPHHNNPKLLWVSIPTAPTRAPGQDEAISKNWTHSPKKLFRMSHWGSGVYRCKHICTDIKDQLGSLPQPGATRIASSVGIAGVLWEGHGSSHRPRLPADCFWVKSMVPRQPLGPKR